MMEWLKNNGKNVIATIVLALSFIGGVFAFDDRYVTAKEFVLAEQRTVQTLKTFQDRQERTYLEQRYQTLTDQMMKQKQMIRTYPKDQELKDDYDVIVKEREDVKQKLNK
jgi:hypothetical protein